MENMLVGAGIVFMAGALIGGGLSAFGVTLPLFSSIKRQVMLFLLGAVLLAGGVYPSLKPEVDPGKDPVENNIEDATESNTQGTALTNAADTDDEDDRIITNTTDTGSVMKPLEEGVNRAGYDFDHMGVDAANAYDCAELCRVNDQCVAMTYVISRRTCWLKKAVPEPKADPDHISALKHQP